MTVAYDPARRARRDPGPTNQVQFFFARGIRPSNPIVSSSYAVLPIRLGHTEREMTLTRTGEDIDVALSGWYRDVVSLNDRQARFLRDRLNEWLGD